MIKDPVTIEEAYDQLSRPAFAVWIRLMMATPKELAVGECKLGALIGYSTTQSNVILHELKRKDFIALIRGSRIGRPSKVVITRRAMIAGGNQFVKLNLHSRS